MKILVLNGPNLNMLGIREPALYGNGRYEDLVRFIEDHCAKQHIEVTIRQSNHEGVLVNWIQQALGVYDALVINPAAYTHTSVALLDALKAVALPAVEVHLTDVMQREDFRHISYIGMACTATIRGKGFSGYTEAIDLLGQSFGK